MCVHVCVHAHVSRYICEGQTTTCKKSVLAFYHVVPGFELGSSGLVESTFPDWAISPALEQLCLGWQTWWVFLTEWWDCCVIISGLSTGLVQKKLWGLQPSSCDSVNICYCLQVGKGNGGQVGGGTGKSIGCVQWADRLPYDDKWRNSCMSCIVFGLTEINTRKP